MDVLWHIIPAVLGAYGIFFAYDWCAVARPTSMGGAARALFPLGCLLLACSFALLMVEGLPALTWDAVAIISLLLALVCAAALVYALFFALPNDTYSAPEKKRNTYTQGMYAICRHPGVLWMCLLCVALAVMLRNTEATIVLALICAGDLAYMLLQDRWSFPHIFCDYQAYQASTPLIFPTITSIKRACGLTGKQPKASGRA